MLMKKGWVFCSRSGVYFFGSLCFFGKQQKKNGFSQANSIKFFGQATISQKIENFAQ